jgi:pyruvate kinase
LAKHLAPRLTPSGRYRGSSKWVCACTQVGNTARIASRRLPEIHIVQVKKKEKLLRPFIMGVASLE